MVPIAGRMVFRIILIALMALGLSVPAEASSRAKISLAGEVARVCSLQTDSNIAPDFSSAACQNQYVWEIDPQGRQLWVGLKFDVPQTALSRDEPLGLLISAKASSQIWLNGLPLGTNGIPAPGVSEEFPGQMDASFIIPPDLLRTDANQLVLRLSAMHGAMRLRYPVHEVTIAPYPSIGNNALSFLPALMTFGLFLAGMSYFGVGALRGYDREGSALLAITSFAAAVQLAAESLRGVVSYPYPWHEWRLIVILLCSTLVVLGLLAYLLLAFFTDRPRARWFALGGSSLAMATIAWVSPGFDAKTLGVLATGAAGGTIVGLLAWRNGLRGGVPIAMASFALGAAMLLIGGPFLDLYLYLAVGALLLWLFAKQARVVSHARTEWQKEAATARELARALTHAERKGRLQPIEVSTGSRTEFVHPHDIRRFSGAGDYVEVHWSSGKSGLHSGSLADFEQNLPPGFIRTHRSHIVNATYVTSLERDAAGTGRLALDDGSEVPVSRRIMPEVRRALR